MWMISNLQVRPRTWTKHGQAFDVLWTLATQNHMTDTLVVNMWSLTMSLSHERLTHLLMRLILNRLLPHRPNIAPVIFGNMTPSTKLGQGIISSHVRSFSSLAMRGGSLPSLCIQNGLLCLTKMLNSKVSQFLTCTFQMKVQRSLKMTWL